MILNPIVDLEPSETWKKLPARIESASERKKREAEATAEFNRKRREAAENDDSVLTERKMLMKLAKFFDFRRNRMFIRSMAFGWEMDFAMVTGSRLLHEIEVKISLSDWQNDRLKDKWCHSNQKKIARFWYAVPGSLISKCPEWVSPETGLIAVGKHVTVFRPAKLVSKYRVTDAELNQLYQSMYFRWWVAALQRGEV